MFFRNNIKSTYMIEQTKDQHISPECEVLEINLDGIMVQTSYHYEPGWDD